MTAAEGGFSRRGSRSYRSRRTAAIEILFASVAVCLLATTSGWADSLTLVNSSPGSSNLLQWSQFGANGTTLGQTFSGSSTGATAVSVSLSGPNSVLAVVCPAGSCSWSGPGMTAGDTLLWTSNGNNGGNGPLTLSFNHAQSTVGALIQADGSSQFTAMIQAFNGSTSLGSFTATSDSKGTAVYLGINDQSGANITSVTFSLASAMGATTDFAIDTVSLNASLGAAPPPLTPAPTPAPVPTRTATSTPTPAPITTPSPAPTPVPSSPGTITFVGAGTLADSASAVSAISIGLPSGVKAGDILLTELVIYDGSATDVPTPPIGWANLRRDTENSGNKASSWLYYHIAGSSEPASYTWAIGTNWVAGVMGAWRGVSSSPIDKASGATAAGTSVSLAAPSQVPGTNGELQVYLYAAQSAVAPVIGVSSSLNSRFNSRSSKEGFTIALADTLAPSVGNASPTYPATTTNAALTAQAILLVAGTQSAPAPTATPVPTAAPTPAPNPSGAMSFVGMGSFSDSSGPVTSVALSLPSGVRSGDAMVAQLIVYDGTGSDIPIAPSGWSTIRHDSVNSGDKLTSWLYYKVAGSSEPASYAWSLGSNYAAGVMGAWRGASSSPIAQSSGAGTSGGDPTSEAAPSLVPAGNGELQLYFYASQSASAPTLTLSNGLNQRLDVRSSKEGFSLAVADAAAPAANVASPTYAASATIGSGAAMTAQAVLLH